ncbi:MAG: hypothetical protein AAGK33_09255 [Pseudomonadota bacterium]
MAADLPVDITGIELIMPSPPSINLDWYHVEIDFSVYNGGDDRADVETYVMQWAHGAFIDGE